MKSYIMQRKIQWNFYYMNLPKSQKKFKHNAKHARFRRGLEERRPKKWEKVRAHKNLILSRNKAQKTAEQVQKNFTDSGNNETKDFPISVNMIHVTDIRKARKRKTYADVVKVTKAQPLISKKQNQSWQQKGR